MITATIPPSIRHHTVQLNVCTCPTTGSGKSFESDPFCFYHGNWGDD